MIRRLYVHNFRCLENFELPLDGKSTVLLIGKNGSGKTSVGLALEIMQRIARGTSAVNDLVKPKDFARGRSDVPMRFELDAEINNTRYSFAIALDFPAGFKALRILEEKLSVDGKEVYSRASADVKLAKAKSAFSLDWHVVYLAISQESHDQLTVFKRWLASSLILRPVPALMTGESAQESVSPDSNLENFGEWFSGLIAQSPAAYVTIDSYLKQIFPDIKAITNPSTGKDSRALYVEFAEGTAKTIVPFVDLSDGEKCFLVCAVVLAANEAYGPLLCFWDEPDAYLSVNEIAQLVTELRRSFGKGGQLMMSSHSSEAVNRFTDDNTLLLHRASRVEPTRVTSVLELREKGVFEGNVAEALLRGEVEP